MRRLSLEIGEIKLVPILLIGYVYRFIHFEVLFFTCFLSLLHVVLLSLVHYYCCEMFVELKLLCNGLFFSVFERKFVQKSCDISHSLHLISSSSFHSFFFLNTKFMRTKSLSLSLSELFLFSVVKKKEICTITNCEFFFKNRNVVIACKIHFVCKRNRREVDKKKMSENQSQSNIQCAFFRWKFNSHSNEWCRLFFFRLMQMWVCVFSLNCLEL